MYLKNCISISVATVLEVSKMTVPICTSHWCLVMSFWLKVCIYSHTRGVKLGLGLGYMQTSQVPFQGNFELRPLGVAMGNVVSVTRV